MMRKILLSLASIIASIIFLASPVSALESGDVVMSLTPSGQDLELTPGQQYQGSVRVSNVGRLAFDLKASVSPYYISDDSYEPDFSTESAYTKMHNWITLAQSEYHIEPGASVDVDFTVDVPSDVSGGGQYAAIMLMAEDPTSDDGNMMQLNTRLAAVLYGHINGGELHAEGELTNHALPRFMFNHDFSISQTVKNTGNVDFRVTQTMTITGIFSNKEIVNADSVDDAGNPIGISNAVVLPGTSRTGILTWDGAPQLGLFRVTQRIRFLDQDYEYSQIVLLCPIWLIVVVIALIIAAIVCIVFKVKKSKTSKPNSALM